MQIGSVFKEKYRIIKKLGSGGMGSVYLAQNMNLGNFLAIKKIQKGNSTINIETEQKILTELNHPAIVKIFDVAEDVNNIYLIEEYIEGCTLAETLYKRNNLGKKIGLSAIDEDVIIEWAKQIAEALDYLHTRRPHPIIYRDLKLGNIMLDSNGKIKIIDFGIAIQQNDEKHTNGFTDLFAAPEQIKDGIANIKTDIYSLGVVLYILALGEKANIVEEYDEKRKKAVKKLSIEPMLELNPNLSIGLVKIVEKCIENDPKNRYKNMKQILDDLKNVYKYNNEYRSLIRKKYVTIVSTILLVGIFTTISRAGVVQLGVEKKQRYDLKIESGERLVNEGNYEMALSVFKEAIAMIPKNSEAYESIGKMYYQIGDYDNCINYFEREAFLEEDSLYKDANCLYILGSAYFKKEDYSLAINRLEKAVEISPHSVNYLRDLAVSYAKNNQIDKANQVLDRLKDERAQEDVTNYVKGEIVLKEGNIEEAIESFKLSLELANDDEIKTKSIISLAETYRDYKVELGYTTTDKEIEILELAKNILEDKNNLVITEMLAKAYYDKAIELGDINFYEKSIESFNTLLSLGYKRPYIYRNIAIIYQQQLNNYLKAEEILLKMKEAFPQDVSCYVQLSLLCIEIENNKSETNRDYQQAYNYYVQAVNYDTSGNNSSLKQLESLINELKSKGWIN